MSIHPALVLLARLRAADGADVDVAARRSSARRRSAARSPTGWRATCSRSATTAPPGKEVRVTGIGERLVAERRAAWERWYGPVAAARWGSARLAHAGVGDLRRARTSARSCSCRRASARRPGNVLLVLAAGSRLSAYIGATVGEIGFLRGIWLDGSRRLAWLEDYAASLVASADLPGAGSTAPTASASSTCRSPTRAPTRLVLDDVIADLPAGAVVAIVGENGAGKTTLVKLLAKMYEPTIGRILVDDVDRSRACRPTSGARGWPARSRTSSASSSARARRSASATCRRLDDEPAVVAAVERAGAGDVVDRLPPGSTPSSGRRGRAASRCRFGQWQKLALARGFMRDEPLLLVLDEPTAALDAETEHALFERYAAPPVVATVPGRPAADDGRITMLVSHRFSTVRMADLIVVLDGARVVEVGTHEELMARGGQYAELYGIQAAAYR